MDEGGLKQVFIAMRPALLRFLAVRNVAPDDAEDVLQDMFVKLDGLKPGPVEHPRTYLYQMANNLAHDRRRADQRRTRRNEAWTSATGGGGHAETDDRPDAERVLIAKDWLRRVEAALDTLPARTAGIFRQFRVEGISQKAIALELGITVSGVEKHLQRAYQSVLDIQESLEHAEPDLIEPTTGGTPNAAR